MKDKYHDFVDGLAIACMSCLIPYLVTLNYSKSRHLEYNIFIFFFFLYTEEFYYLFITEQCLWTFFFVRRIKNRQRYRKGTLKKKLVQQYGHHSMPWNICIKTIVIV